MAAEKIDLQYPSKIIMSSDEYHANPAIGSSSLKKVLRSPAHYKEYKANPPTQTSSQRFGTAVHYAILEPDLFKKMVVIQPKFGGKGAHAARDHWLMENHDKIFISKDEREAIDGILLSVSKHPIASGLLAAGFSEESYFWKDKKTGVACKCRPDYFRVGAIMADLKTTIDASFLGFQREIAKWKYHLSGAFYVDGVFEVTLEMIKAFVLIAIEPEPPYAVGTYYLDDGTLDAGRYEYGKALIAYDRCLQSGIYPAYSDDLLSMSLPSWAFPAGGEG